MMISKVFLIFQVGILALVLNPVFFAQAQTSEYSLEYDKYIFFHWKGALTSHSITLKVFPNLSELNSTQYNTYISLYTKSDLGDVQMTSLNPINFEQTQYPVTEVVLGPLANNTKYYYSFIFMKTGSVDSQQFQTIYKQGVPSEFSFNSLGVALTPYSFTFGASSCATTGSNNSIFTTLKNQNFDFFIHMGDLHYSDIAENNVEKIYEAYYKVFSSSTQKPFFQSTPIFYVWDDHDFGSGNAVGTSPSNPAVNSAYRTFVPHGTLKNNLPADDYSTFPNTAPQASTNAKYVDDPTTQTNTGVFQSFIVGRCLFIIMDLRSFKDVKSGDILGDGQTAWLENQLRYAGYNDGIVQVFIVSSFPWIHEGKPTEWSPYTNVQTNISTLINNYIYKYDKEIMMLSGDSHMIAFDDGSSNIYGEFPVVQAAAMDRYGSCKGGPYSHGFATGPNHYGSLEVTDDGVSLCIKINLKDQDDKIIEYDTCNPNKYPGKLAYCPVTNPTTVVSADNDNGLSLTIIISIGILLVGIISCVVYNKSRREQEPDVAPPEIHKYFEMTEPFGKRSNNN